MGDTYHSIIEANRDRLRRLAKLEKESDEWYRTERPKAHRFYSCPDSDRQHNREIEIVRLREQTSSPSNDDYPNRFDA